mmetsp:Transcript_4600/g.6292  ORF Transcript_4600/g.6292 Transcript_4600/m.6292 type:complete len:238 (-) Transcript_4600:56-769(-)|eukprot:CAMPEP_0185724598 /NCGR_PEP_ID=MMETSP1171-20130828/1030_1 /TAXON_ID=374046 /ORGANISM="Helicotheca tamensis, Strain CCMP826" /LENGTH=237 /DNA_ID=CAMNT_0028392479 /DNA_START=163 /DNA_END=876 /DNA_ORIENTATION=-
MSSLLSNFFSSTSSSGAATRERKATQRISVVCISDTHGCHREVHIPDGDILIHAGDFTHFGKEEDAKDFNDWLGELPHKHKIVVNGNHESNATWSNKAEEMLHNAKFLLNSQITVGVRNVNVRIHGTQFFWPMNSANPYYDKISDPVDIFVCHGPVAGMVDGKLGCKMLRQTVERLKPILVVSGHIHQAHGQCEGLGGIQFVNAANCANGYRIENPAIYVQLDIPCAEDDDCDIHGE